MTENPKLFLQKISVTNYRSYCGKNEIDIVLKELYRIKKLNLNKKDKQLNDFINKIENIN